MWQFPCYQGVLFRYSILFPLRLIIFLLGLVVLISMLLMAPLVIREAATRAKWQRLLLRWICSVFVMSWTGVIRYHGVIPARRPNQVQYVKHLGKNQFGLGLQLLSLLIHHHLISLFATLADLREQPHVDDRLAGARADEHVRRGRSEAQRLDRLVPGQAARLPGLHLV